MASRADGYRVAVVGARAVGQEMLRVLKQRKFPAQSIRVFATREREMAVDGDTYHVEVISDEAFADVDVAFFAGGDEKEGHFGPVAAARGCVVIDNGDAFRMDPEVPLVVPEVNPDALRGHHNLIANPNCSTIQFVVALKPLHDAARLKRAVVRFIRPCRGGGRPSRGRIRSRSFASRWKRSRSAWRRWRRTGLPGSGCTICARRPAPIRIAW